MDVALLHLKNFMGGSSRQTKTHANNSFCTKEVQDLQNQNNNTYPPSLPKNITRPALHFFFADKMRTLQKHTVKFSPIDGTLSRKQLEVFRVMWPIEITERQNSLMSRTFDKISGN